jgi:glycosyltransferase involved in cell wall biosynthesis
MNCRVLLATNSCDRGSTSRTLESWARLLPACGIDPIVTLGGDGPLLDVLRQSGIPVYEHPIRFFFEPRRPLPFLSAIAKLAWRIRQSGADLVHVNEHEHYPVVGRAAYLAGVPTVVHIRFKPEAAMCRWLFKPPYTPHRVFFTSRTQMDDSYANVASAVPPDRFRLIYNGLDFEAFGTDEAARARVRSEWMLEPTAFVVGTASSISPRKRLSHFVRLVVNLAHSGLPVKGFIAGRPYFAEDEREMSALQRLVSDLGAEQLVTFLGYVEPAEPLYHAWDVCVSTSEYETFGMTMLEAMACGCPVLAYPGGSVAEIIGDGGTVVPDSDLEALTAACARFVTSESHRAEMGARSTSRRGLRRPAIGGPTGRRVPHGEWRRSKDGWGPG